MTTLGDVSAPAAALVERLERIGLVQLLGQYQRSGTRTADIAAGRDGLPEALGLAVDLLCLHRPARREQAELALGRDGADFLLHRGIAIADGDEFRLDQIRLVEHYGRLVLVGLPGAHHNGYYGMDSVGLGRMLLGARGRCIDLFASTGAQSVLMARTAAEVHAVELDASLARLFELNTELNGCARRVTPHWADVREVRLDGPYDSAAVNPPLIPSFGLPGLMTGADGGPDGRALLTQALERIELTSGGRLWSTSTIVGAQSGPETGWLRELAARRGWSINVHVTGVGMLQPLGAFGRELVATLASASGQPGEAVLDQLSRQWAEAAIDRVHFCLLRGAPAAGPARGPGDRRATRPGLVAVTGPAIQPWVAAADWQRLVARCPGAWFSHDRDWCTLVDADPARRDACADASFVVTGHAPGDEPLALVPCAASPRPGGTVVSGLTEPSGPMLSSGLDPADRARVWELIDRQFHSVATASGATSIVLRYPVLVSAGPRGQSTDDEAVLGALGYRLRSRQFYCMDLTSGEDELWHGVSSRVRTQIGAAMRTCQVTEAAGPADLARLCQVFSAHSAAKGAASGMTPELITRLAASDSGLLVRPLLATSGADLAGFALSFGIGQCASLFAWGSTAAALHTQVSKLIVWQALLDLKARGVQWVEYGGAIADMARYAGLTEFYRRIGGQTRQTLLAYRLTG